MHRTQFRNPNRKAEREKRKEEKIGGRMLSLARDEIGTAKLFTNSKFCMISVALIPVMNYNAQIAFKKRIVI